jgi:hypothetical protein
MWWASVYLIYNYQLIVEQSNQAMFINALKAHNQQVNKKRGSHD